MPGWSNEGVTHDFLGENGCDFVDSAKQANQRLCTAWRQLSSGLSSDLLRGPVWAGSRNIASIG
jgi:hypothetical protein